MLPNIGSGVVDLLSWDENEDILLARVVGVEG